MPIDQIFNELSADGSCVSREEAVNSLVLLGEISEKMNSIGFSSSLRTTSDFRSRELCPGFTVDQCIRENIKNDKIRLLLSYAAKSPYVAELLDIGHGEALSEFRYKGVEAFGLALAYMNGIPALSLSCFPEGEILLDRVDVSSEEISSGSVNAESLSSHEGFARRRESLQNIVWSSIRDGQGLLEIFGHLFPRLRLSGNAKKNIASLTGNEAFFLEFMRHFSILNDTALQWKKGSKFNPQGTDWTNDTKETLQRYGEERTFVCADGVTRTFSAHSKIKRANQRIYFFHDSKENVVHIGCAGVHLKTAKYH